MEIYTAWNEVGAVQGFRAEGLHLCFRPGEYVPTTYVKLDEENTIKMEKLLDMLESDDVRKFGITGTG